MWLETFGRVMVGVGDQGVVYSGVIEVTHASHTYIRITEMANRWRHGSLRVATPSRMSYVTNVALMKRA